MNRTAIHPIALSPLLAGLVAATMSAAVAAVEPQVASSVEVTAPATLPVHALRELTGRYRLSDGRELRVDRHGLHLWAQVGRARAQRLDDAGGHRFASVDGRTTIAFEPMADGSVDRLRLTETRAGSAARVAQATPD